MGERVTATDLSGMDILSAPGPVEIPTPWWWSGAKVAAVILLVWGLGLVTAVLFGVLVVWAAGVACLSLILSLALAAGA